MGLFERILAYEVNSIVKHPKRILSLKIKNRFIAGNIMGLNLVIFNLFSFEKETEDHMYTNVIRSASKII